MLGMLRQNLITKEKSKAAYLGKLKNEKAWENEEISFNDDLELFLSNLKNSKEIEFEVVASFFIPKLTNEELKLVESRDPEHLNTYLDHYIGENPDVEDEEMKKSDSKSKFVHGRCIRLTFPLTLESNDPNSSNDGNSDESTETEMSESLHDLPGILGPAG